MGWATLGHVKEDSRPDCTFPLNGLGQSADGGKICAPYKASTEFLK